MYSTYKNVNSGSYVSYSILQKFVNKVTDTLKEEEEQWGEGGGAEEGGRKESGGGRAKLWTQQKYLNHLQ